ncbi:MAG: DNA-methyltransferase [Dehalococcoidia bacterium]
MIATYFNNGISRLYQADVRTIPLPDRSIHCVVTSPPYFGLRVYSGVEEGGIGLESSVEEYLTNLVDVFREVRRVLRDDGVCWVNIGESRGGYHGNAQTSDDNAPSNKPGYIENMRPSNTMGLNRLGIPERLALALQADGWIWRDTVIWAKKSPMPESVHGTYWEPCRVKVGNSRFWKHQDSDGYFEQTPTAANGANQAEWAPCPGCDKCLPNDGLVLRRGSWRCTSSHEYILMLVKGPGYWADGEAVRQTAVTSGLVSDYVSNGSWHDHKDDKMLGNRQTDQGKKFVPPGGANRRSVWNDITPEPYIKPHGTEGHYATFPSDLPRICIQASTSEFGCCPRCGAQWARVLDKSPMVVAKSGNTNGMRTAIYGTQVEPAQSKTLRWRQTCSCQKYGLPLRPVPTTVLDPFVGTGTTCLAAQRLGRRSVGVDLSEDYLQQAVSQLETVPLPLGTNDQHRSNVAV